MSPNTVLLWLLFVFILALIGLWGIKRAVTSGESTYESKTGRRIRTEYGVQMEFDMRLPYRRFRQLYPYSKVTYEEYKQMQRRRAYKRAVGSEKNKRMVR